MKELLKKFIECAKYKYELIQWHNPTLPKWENVTMIAVDPGEGVVELYFKDRTIIINCLSYSEKGPEEELLS